MQLRTKQSEKEKATKRNQTKFKPSLF